MIKPNRKARSRPAWWAAALVLAFVGTVPRAAAEVTFHVAVDGNDAATGTAAAPDATTGAGPFRTLERARDAVRQLKQQGGGKLPGPVTVRVGGGTYFLSAPLLFRGQDSGSADAPVTYAAADNAKPVLSGGFPVSGWAVKQVNGRTAWVVTLPERANAPVVPREMWINGARRTPARHPNEGYFRVVDMEPGHGLQPGHTDFAFAPGDVKAWPSVTQATAVVYNRWSESHMPVTRVDEAASRIYFSKVSLHGLEKEDPYHLEGAADFLDQPGEWHLDRKTATLTYLPMPGEEPGKAEVVLPNLTRVVVIDGAPEKRELVSHLVFRGLTFAHSEYTTESPGAPVKMAGWTQAAIGVPSAVEATGLRDSLFEDCTFTDAGSYGLALGRGSQGNRVSRCTFTKLGAGEVRIGETRAPRNAEERASRNEVADSRVFECGLLYPSCVGVWIGQASENRLHHNEISDLPYTGISVGWTWGYAETQCHANVIEHNHVHHIGVRSGGREPLLSDMGGIYMLGHQPGAVVRRNRFHDLAGRKYGGWGIYFDEGSRDIVAEQNVVYRTTHGGFHQHYGRDNVVRNNVFALARVHQIQRTRNEPHRSFTFERNIVYWDQGEAVMGNWSGFNVVFDNNVWCRTDGKQDYKIGYLTRDQWQSKGLDVHSVFADPMFADPAEDDYNLKPDSPAIKLGFETWDQADIGPRKPR